LTGPACKCKLAALTPLAVSVFPRSPFHRIVTSKISSAEPVAEPTADFERSLAELESIVDKLEQGDLSLDDSLRHFERGVQLTRACQGALKQAEQKVEILLRRSGADDFAAAPFDSDEDSER
jgi:exodeoxyribonuclease VII small subunit